MCVCVRACVRVSVLCTLPTDIVEYLLDKTQSSGAGGEGGGAKEGGGAGGESKVELGNSEGRTLLHIAALTDNRPLVTYLLDKHHASKASVWTHKVCRITLRSQRVPRVAASAVNEL